MNTIFDKLKDGANEIRADKSIPAIKRNLLASILEGDHQNAERLFALEARMEQLKLVAVNSTNNICQFPRKPIEQEFAECAERVKKLKNASNLEKNTLIAICNGDIDEANRLMEIAKKRNELKLKVIG